MLKKKINFIHIPSYFNYINKRVIIKCLLLIFLSLFLLASSFAWMYHDFNSGGAIIKLGSISHEVREYDSTGNLISDNDETTTLIYSDNMSNITKGTRYIEVKNTGSLDMEFSLTFNLDGNIGETGILYYRLYDITNQVKNYAVSDSYSSKLMAYAATNPIPSDIETNTSNPIYNISTINNRIVFGKIEKDNDNDENNSLYYRFDYGIYTGIDSAIYSNMAVALHMNVYSSQVGTISKENSIGKIWDVANEEQFRAAIQGAYAGDTIRLLDDIIIDGTVEFNKRINLDTNNQLFKVTGDLLFEFVSFGKLNINTTGSGRIEVGNNFYINTPKAEVSLTGANKASDIVVNNKMIVNGIQDGEKDGILLDNVRIVKNTTSYIPIDLTVLSNTRLTISPNVTVGFITANDYSTNIEIINNGTISQIQLQNMNLLNTFTKPQIYIYNLGEILGTLGTASILLPPTAAPYKGIGDGNTLIVKGVTSSDITVSGSDKFNNSEIDDVTLGTSVIPFDDEENAYYVYIREPSDVLEELLTKYFKNKGEDPELKTALIKKLEIYTLNAQYLENEDFDFLKSSKIPNLEYLDLSSSRVIDGSTLNRIKEHALENKTSLKKVLLPKTLTEIGSYAFYGIELGYLSPDPLIDFNILELPSSIDVIEPYAFYNTDYVKFTGTVPPRTIYDNAFNFSNDGTKMFVPEGTEDLYQQHTSLNSSNIFRNASISDNRRYFVYEVGEDLGISYVVNNSLSTTTLGVPNQLSYLGASKKIVELGTNSYRHLNISDTEGVNASIPNTITKINSYAFYGLNIINIDLTNVEFIGKYAFYSTNLQKIIAPKAKDIEDYAFYKNNATILSLSDIERIGKYAFGESQKMYEANLAKVSFIDDGAFYDCKNLSRVYFENDDARLINNREEINMTVGTNSVFSNWGFYIDGRLRVYVPGGVSTNGNTYLSLYKDKFSDYTQYIYETGINIGSYYHMEVPYDLYEYTVKEKTITGPSGNVSVGLEIISYQGQDLDEDYELPLGLTVNNNVVDVISIGDNAYRNTSTVSGKTVTIFNDNIVNIGSYAFKDLAIKSFTAKNVERIGSYAFEGSSLNKGIFRGLISLGDYAFTNLDQLYVLDLGPVKEFGFNSIANNRYLEQLFISNKDLNINLNNTSFSNLGTNTNGRFRIYVPDVDLVLAYYKKLLPDYEKYIYPTGRIEGSFVNSPIDYDIGEYSLREKIITDKNGVIHTGYELIEYHGADLTPGYNIPEVISPITSNVKITWTKSNCWADGLTCNYKATITNNSDNVITSWEFDLALPTGTKIQSSWGANCIMHDGYVTVKDEGYNGTIPINGSISTFNMQVTYPDIYTKPEVTSIRINLDSDTGNLPIISVGDYAYYHANTFSGYTFSVNNNSILYIGKGAFEGNKGLESFESTSVEVIDNDAFKNSGLVTGTFNNLNTIKSMAFANNSKLYKLNLGTVMNMEEKAIADCNYLYQIYFKGTTLNFNYHIDSLYNIGSLTGNRLRIYVSEGTDISDSSYAFKYSQVFNQNYRYNFFEVGEMVGTYVPDTINNNVGTMTLKKVTLKNSNNLDTVGWEIIEYHGPLITNDVDIPNSFTVGTDSYPIISIGNNAFRSNQIDTGATLNIPTGVLRIGDYAFYKNTFGTLNAVNVEEIGSYAFSECQYLNTVNLDNIVTVGSHAFYNNPNLKSVSLSSSIHTLKDYAFYNSNKQNNLTYMYLTTSNPPTIEATSLPELVNGISNLTVFVPYSSIDSFKNATYWKDYNISNIGNIYDQTFVYENLGNNEIKITGYLKQTTDLVIPSVLNIGGQEYTVTQVEGSMFNSIQDIKTLTLPSSLKSLDDNFLLKNSSIESIIIDSSNPNFKTVDGVLYNKDGSALIKYPNGKINSEFTVPSGVILIKSNAFSNAFNLTSVVFDTDLYIISSNSFTDCINLVNITFTGTMPPYITAFNVFPVNKNTKIYVPAGTLSTYLENVYYYNYKNYMVER